jgi:hypothetical protein
MLVRLALVGFLLSVLVLSLQDVASLVAGEAMGSRRLTTLGAEFPLVLSRAEEHPLTIAAHLGSQTIEQFMRDGSDVDNDDSSAIPLLIRRIDFLAPAPVGIDLNGYTHACVRPARYLVRPQLLSRL